MYDRTGGVNPCVDMVINTSAADFLHIAFCGGQVDVTAEKRRTKSSFLANSSAGAGWELRRMRSWTKIFCRRRRLSIGEKSEAGPFVSGG